MPVTDELIPVLKKLRLSGVLQTLDLRTKQAVDDNLGHAEFLFRLCTDEVERRESKQLELRLRRASFDSAKRLEDFEWSFNPCGAQENSDHVALSLQGLIPRLSGGPKDRGERDARAERVAGDGRCRGAG